jgi:glycosyltransferase involved in cell wall biosynthesis
MKFSITIPAYKSSFLRECIESVLSQTYKDFEVVIVDDHSPYHLDEIVKSFSDNRICYFKNDRNYGAVDVVDNWNKCLEYAKGDYIICMGDDDMLLPHCLENYVKIMNEYPDLNIYHTRTDLINDEGKLVDRQEERPIFETAYSLAWHGFKGRVQFIGDFCYKASTLRNNGGFYKFPLALSSDYVSAIIAAGEKGIANVRESSFLYRIHDTTISNIGNNRILMDSCLQIEKWYKGYVEKVEPVNEDDKKYRELIPNEITSFFKKQKQFFLYRDFKSGIFSSLIYWHKNKKKYGFTLTEITVALLLAVARKIKRIVKR